MESKPESVQVSVVRRVLGVVILLAGIAMTVLGVTNQQVPAATAGGLFLVPGDRGTVRSNRACTDQCGRRSVGETDRSGGKPGSRQRRSEPTPHLGDGHRIVDRCCLDEHARRGNRDGQGSRTRGDGQSIPRRRHGEQFRFGTASRRVGHRHRRGQRCRRGERSGQGRTDDRRARFVGRIRRRRCAGERCSAYRDLGTRGRSVGALAR